MQNPWSQGLKQSLLAINKFHIPQRTYCEKQAWTNVFFLDKYELRPVLFAVESDSSDNAFEEGSDTSATMSFASDFSTDSDL